MRKRVQMADCLLQVTALTAIFLAAGGQAKGATVEAKSPALADVKSAIASAHDGDTVMVPAGEASWTSPLVITKGITLQGATSIDGSSKSPAVTDRTVVLDDVPRESRGHPPAREQQGPRQRPAAFFVPAGPLRGQSRPVSKSNATGVPKTGHMPAIIIATLKPTLSFRLTGFTFRYGSLTMFADNGGVHLVGTCPSARIDHCHFDQLYANPFIMTDGGGTPMAMDPGQMQLTLEARSSCLSKTTPSVTLMAIKAMALIPMVAAGTWPATITWSIPQ